MNIAYGSVQDILVNDFGFRHLLAKFVPKNLNIKHESNHVDIAKYMISKADSNPTFIKRTITGDEMRAYEYDTQYRHQASEWRTPSQPRPEKSLLFSQKRK